MKVYISADIEGCTFITDWKETEQGEGEYAQGRRIMTKEVAAACEGALAAGATEIVIKDAHDSALNLIPDSFPEEATLIRGWTCTPESMVAGIDETFDAAVFIGYHSGAGFDGNPLAHTMNGKNNYVKINGRPSAEFDLNAYTCAHYHVPVVFVSGDEELCAHAKELVPEITSVGVKRGVGEATFSMNLTKACRLIKEGVTEALGKIDRCLIESPESFHMEINFKDPANALRGSFYPGARQIDPRTVAYTGKDIQDMMAARMFIL